MLLTLSTCAFWRSIVGSKVQKNWELDLTINHIHMDAKMQYKLYVWCMSFFFNVFIANKPSKWGVSESFQLLTLWMLNQNLKQIILAVSACSYLVKTVMFGLNPLRAENFQSNVFKLLLLSLLSLFTCGLVTAVVVRFLDSTATTQQLSQSANLQQPEMLLGDELIFKVNFHLSTRI